MSVERWLPISRYEGLYEVSDKGRIRSLRLRGGCYDKPRAVPRLRAIRLHNGYYIIDLPHPDPSQRIRENNVTYLVHRLVCEAFHGPCPDGFQCAHLNGDRSDCRANNLRWVSPVENQSHRIMHGTDCRGSKQYGAKLTDSDVLTIRSSYTGKRGQVTRLSERFGCSVSNIGSIIHRRTWGHLHG